MNMNQEMDVDLEVALPKSTPSVRTSASPARQRPALPQEAHGITATRTSDDEATSLEVDHMILDYFLHDAIQPCHNNPQSINAAILRVDDFLALFNHRYPLYTPDPELYFRQLLLQLLTLITNRYEQASTTPPLSSLLTLRAENASHAKVWVQFSHPPQDFSNLNQHLPLDPQTLFTHRKTILTSINIPSSSAEFYGSPSSPSLLDLLPLFMNLSALACTKLYAGNINDQWMRLASEWMFQACLEQVLIYGVRDAQCISQAFAWGYQRDRPEGDDVNDMFEDVEYRKEVEGWEGWKEKVMGKLLMAMDDQVEEDSSFEERLQRLARENPLKEFEANVKGFLEALGRSIPEPVLLQLEKGKLEGLSPDDTRDFLSSCGVGKGGLLAAAVL